MGPFFAAIEDELSRALYIKRMAQVLEVPEAQIKTQLDRRRQIKINKALRHYL
jgi:plasmid maintenance system antidote protein VapI